MKIPETKNPETQKDDRIKPANRGFVLVVDDEEFNRCLLRDPLEAQGYEVAEAENGLQALQHIATRLPDVILLDLMMPEMNGIDVCRQLRKDPRMAHLPVLMVTALSERGDRLLSIHAGANDFLNKPVDIQDVILRVRNAVHVKRLHDQLQAEQLRSEELLLNILPAPIAERMKQGETNIANSHPEVTVLVADLIGFTSLTAHVGPEEIVRLLNEIFSAFDLVVEKHQLEKIKTVGDAYIVTAGLVFDFPDRAAAMVELALDFQEAIDQLNQMYDTSIGLRIGISTGPVVAGVIGRHRFSYDLWGEAVNLAHRLQSVGEAGSILLSETTHEQLKDKYAFEPKQLMGIKGYDHLSAYQLSRRGNGGKSDDLPGISQRLQPVAT